MIYQTKQWQYQTFKNSFIQFLNLVLTKKEHSLDEVRELLTYHFSLTDEESFERVPSGAQTKFDNRIYWVKSYFNKAKLIEYTRRSHFRITERGLRFLEEFTNEITINDLKTIPEFKAFSDGTSTSVETYQIKN